MKSEKFNKIWTKEKNILMRNLIKEGKSVDYIKKFFGDDLNHHPKNRYKTGKMKTNFQNFLKEIIISPENIHYDTFRKKSRTLENRYDYILKFSTDNDIYFIVLFYNITNNIHSYNLLLTTETQFNLYENKLDEISKQRDYITDLEFEELVNIVETMTNYNEFIKLLKYVSYILFSFHLSLKGIPYSITETDDERKIKIYKNIIKDSFENIKETSQLGKDVKLIYYYEIL